MVSPAEVDQFVDVGMAAVLPVLGQYGYPAGAPRQAGLRDLDGLNFVTEVYRNADAVIYRLNP
ncbi:hypothetical protein [Amycolatopsis sp. cmx-4-54]|uniref:hypothetical protein n=1 Tax=Amycolatopsis sp. cmx-4-54 TaxID=2790936 RepID=UPI00397A97B8